MRDHCHLGSHEEGLGEGQAARESVLHLDFTIQPVCGEWKVGGEGSSEGGPNSGPTDFLQLHLTGIQALPTTPGPQRPSALSIHLRISKKVYLKKLG